MGCMILVLVLVLIIVNSYNERNSIFCAITDGILYFLLLLYIITEMFSVFSMLTYSTILAVWGIIAVICLCFIGKDRQKLIQIKSVIKNRKRDNLWLFFALLSIAMLLLSVISISANWDSMTYHLPRIMHWIQNKSVAFYATNIARQIFSPPLSEYVMMHVMLLGGNDFFVCAVQGSCYVAGAVLIYGTSEKMNIEKTYRYFAVLLFMLMPPAIAEAVTTQNDLFSALIMLVFFYYYLDFLYVEKLSFIFLLKKLTHKCL